MKGNVLMAGPGAVHAIQMRGSRTTGYLASTERVVQYRRFVRAMNLCSMSCAVAIAPFCR